jgi:hypothetical protein
LCYLLAVERRRGSVFLPYTSAMEIRQSFGPCAVAVKRQTAVRNCIEDFTLPCRFTRKVVRIAPHRLAPTSNGAGWACAINIVGNKCDAATITAMAARRSTIVCFILAFSLMILAVFPHAGRNFT